jgi:hypothetical protein
MEKKVCTEIAEKTSSLGVANRTTNEIKEKWNYLKKEARNVFTNHRARENSASFKGLDEVDTCIQIQQDSDGKITLHVC